MRRALISSLLATLFGLICLAAAIFLSVTRWKDYVRGKANWTKVTCSIVSSQIRECPLKSKSDSTGIGASDHGADEMHRHNMYGIEVVVEGDFLIDGEPAFPKNDNKTAYRDHNNIDCGFREKADAEQESAKYPNGTDTSCYVDLLDKGRIRLSEGNDPERIPKLRFLAIVPILLAVLSGIFVIFMAKSFITKAVRYSRGQNGNDDDDAAASGRVLYETGPSIRGNGIRRLHERRRGTGTQGRRHNLRRLTRYEARRVITILQATTEKTDLEKSDNTSTHTGCTGDNQVCAICLEEFSGVMAESVTLPCAHRYHDECALRWFQKGGSTCPCCNYDVAPLVRRRSSTESSDNDDEDANGYDVRAPAAPRFEDVRAPGHISAPTGAETGDIV